MHDFEKLGAFYLGRKADTRSGDLSDELVLYDSKDLTTHAVIIGMTGSGKTGLGIGLIEEAALDHVPVIADTAYDAQNEELTEVLIKAKVADVQVPIFGLLWTPYRDAGDGRLAPAWSPSLAPTK